MHQTYLSHLTPHEGFSIDIVPGIRQRALKKAMKLTKIVIETSEYQSSLQKPIYFK